MKTTKFFICIIILACVSIGFSEYLRPPMIKCPQHKSSWCWAGAAEAILSYYGPLPGCDSCAWVITTANSPQPLSVIAKIVNKFYPAAEATTNNGVKPTEADAKAEADKCAPFAMFWPGHFVTYAGYEDSIHLIMNPWPPSVDSTGGKWQSLTFKAVLNANGSGTWSGLTKTKGKVTGIHDQHCMVHGNNTLKAVQAPNQSIALVLPALSNTQGILTIFNVRGKAVYSKQITQGTKSVQWNASASAITSGLYVAKYTGGNNQRYVTKVCVSK